MVDFPAFFFFFFFFRRILFVVSVITALNLVTNASSPASIKREQCCKFPADCRPEGLVYGRVFQSIQVELQSAFHALLDLLQPESEI